MSKLVLKLSTLVMALGLFGSNFAQAEGFGYVAIAFNPANPAQYGAVHGGYTTTDWFGNRFYHAYDSQESVTQAAFDALNSVNDTSGMNINYTWAHNGWVALAMGQDQFGGTHFGTSANPNYDAHISRDVAEQTALANCDRAAGPGQCILVRSLSSFSNYSIDPPGYKRMSTF